MITAHEIDRNDLRHAEETGDFVLAHMVWKRLRLEVVLNGPLIREAKRVMQATRYAA